MNAGSRIMGDEKAEARTLLNDSGQIIDRLREIRDRVMKLSSALHGSQPRDASEEKAKAPDESSLRRNLDRALGVIGAIEAELNGIEARL